MKKMLLKNADVISPDQASENCAVLIVDGRVVKILSNEQAIVLNEETVFDLNKAQLFSGFIDVHNHGAIGVDANAADVEGLHEVSTFLARNGVTAWLPSLVPDSFENYQKAIRAIDELIETQNEREPAARVIGVHYEGPFVSEKQCGALRVEYFKDFQNGDELNDLPKLKAPGAVHLITVAPEIPGGIDLIQKLRVDNWIVSIGHTRADAETLDKALTVGARHLTHFFNAMTGLHHRDIGVVGWGLANKEVTFDIIADGVHVQPTVLRFAAETKTPQKTVLISDSVAPTGLGDGDFEIWGEKISVVNGKTQNARGSIAGSVITMREAVNRMLSLGFSASEVSQMAAANPARLLGLENEMGIIETGKRADLTAIDDAGNVRLTIVGGRVAFQNL